MLFTQFICFLVLFSQKALGTRVWVDDTDASIVYTGNWTFASGRANSGLYKDSEAWSDQPGATATFKFDGTSIEYWGNQGYYHGACKIEINGKDHGFVESWALKDGPTILLFKYTQDFGNTIYPNRNQSHIFSVSVPVPPPNPPASSGQTDNNRCEIDYFIYSTTIDPAQAPPSDSSKDSSDAEDLEVIKITVPLGIAFLVFLTIFGWYCYRKLHPTPPAILPQTTVQLPQTPILPATDPIRPSPVVAQMNHSPSQVRRSGSSIDPHDAFDPHDPEATEFLGPSSLSGLRRFRIPPQTTSHPNDPSATEFLDPSGLCRFHVPPQDASNPNGSASTDISAISSTPLMQRDPRSRGPAIIRPFPPGTIKNDVTSRRERYRASRGRTQSGQVLDKIIPSCPMLCLPVRTKAI